ncbi:metal-sulfur cluster biosynthetic enzyme [Rhodococcus sp. LBL1]|uniref:Metal-sulfur cluster biosynthetic enzyme n=1 Tax=Prescottella agglutinans TaxID=1644129 RepID=A0ABT6MAF8_9NOCA|nr:metal-sulfur cluster assembly factor [Prescottella agglutinans]MDH6281298.1 metal-sulfur cluster biosynthetic enzyme [Prescottella agglutinans]MDH6678865.1 metal-sulfur cluster biosynthetic enzyme [Rhodococcus sp. LBL1]MDH6684257.1 metal-sulfur cluster biosynthetic enzyme [Rhodococcus sp. LBL2]
MTDTQAEQAQPESAEVEATAEYGATLTPERLDELEEAMRDVVDPELGINVVDLGLVYDFKEIDENGVDVVLLDMTLTSAACPLTDVIEEQSKRALVNSSLCDELRINWVWMPPWGPDKITDDGREQLRALGFTV